MEIALSTIVGDKLQIIVTSLTNLTSPMTNDFFGLLSTFNQSGQIKDQTDVDGLRIVHSILQIPSEWNSNGMETLLLSGILGKDDDPDVILHLLHLTTNKIQEVPNIFHGLYENPPHDQDASKISEMKKQLHELVLDCKKTLYPNRQALQTINSDLNVLGIQKVGKSSIVYRMTQGDFNPDIRPTLAPNVLKLILKNINFRVHDVAGQVKFRNTWTQQFVNPQAIIYVIDSAAELSDQKENVIWFQKMMRFYFEAPKRVHINTPVLILANKQDINPKFTIDEVEKLYQPRLVKMNYAIFCVSALTGQGLSDAFTWLVKQIQKLY